MHHTFYSMFEVHDIFKRNDILTSKMITSWKHFGIYFAATNYLHPLVVLTNPNNPRQRSWTEFQRQSQWCQRVVLFLLFVVDSRWWQQHQVTTTFPARKMCCIRIGKGDRYYMISSHNVAVFFSSLVLITMFLFQGRFGVVWQRSYVMSITHHPSPSRQVYCIVRNNSRKLGVDRLPGNIANFIIEWVSVCTLCYAFDRICQQFGLECHLFFVISSLGRCSNLLSSIIRNEQHFWAVKNTCSDLLDLGI